MGDREGVCVQGGRPEGPAEPGSAALGGQSPRAEAPLVLAARPPVHCGLCCPRLPAPGGVSALPGGLRPPRPSLCSHGALMACHPPYSGAVCTAALGRGPQ